VCVLKWRYINILPVLSFNDNETELCVLLSAVYFDNFMGSEQKVWGHQLRNIV